MIIVKKNEFEKLYSIACDTWKEKFKNLLKDFIFSDNIEFKEEFIEEMRKACTADQLTIFNEIFKDYIPKNLFEGISDYKSFCIKSNHSELILSDFKHSIDPKRAFALEKLEQIKQYFNKGIALDWDNHNQQKWYPWYYTGSGGLRFGRSYYHYRDFCGGVAFFIDQETSDFVGKTFIDIYKDLVY
jgi:hypothetical protein